MSNSSLVLLLRTSSVERWPIWREGAPYKHVSICKIVEIFVYSEIFSPHLTSVFSLLCKHHLCLRLQHVEISPVKEPV